MDGSSGVLSGEQNPTWVADGNIKLEERSFQLDQARNH